jgi:D-alanine--poly(phosphoribitol) ligase subunit 2
MTDLTEWLLDWFAKRGQVPGATREEQLAVNYFQAGLIDSFGVIELIADVESQFCIRFTEHHFQDRRFPTIGGLAMLVNELRQTNA